MLPVPSSDFSALLLSSRPWKQFPLVAVSPSPVSCILNHTVQCTLVSSAGHSQSCLPQLSGPTWKKEEELKGLKAELAALDRKIQLELAPPVQEKDISDKSQTENNTIKSGEFHSDTIVQQERKIRIGL